MVSVEMGGSSVGPAAEPRDDQSGAVETLRTPLKEHCFRCHGDSTEVGGKVNLVKAFAGAGKLLSSDLEQLKKLIDALADGEMPPEDAKQPTKEERAIWLLQLRGLMKTRMQQGARLASTPIRRMNRLQYNNAVKQLFQLRRDPFALPERTLRDIGRYFDPASGRMPQVVVVGNRAMGKSQFIGTGNTLPGVAAFPKDNRAEHGFNNQGDHLSLSPALMESFFSLGQSIVNSPEFPIHAAVWTRMFTVDEDLSDAELRSEGRRRLGAFLRRAFRRDVTEEIVSRYHRRFLQKLDGGQSFTESMKAAVSAVLVSPRFLYLYSGVRPAPAVGNNAPDFALASRLSFFLWNTIPDDTLLDLASNGTLRDPKVLGQQVDRMLNDRRMKDFCDSFPLQWLQLDQMVAAVPDNKRFRPYYFGGATGMVYMVGMHMMLEPLLVFETVLVENRPITDFIDPDFSYRSELLKNWYDGNMRTRRMEVVSIRFRRVPIEDRRFGGVITNAAVLTMTSSPLRTKPISRGAWLVSTVFNDPPAPPPADVPVIEDEQLEREGITLREKLMQHIAKPQCAGCHRKIDPFGFALENYDPVGRWRETYPGGLPVDSRGTLFRKHAFAGPIGFKDAILAEKDRFARALAGHLLSYALGRKLDIADQPSLDQIVRNSAKDDYRFRTLIKQVVLSPSVTNRRAIPEAVKSK